MSHSDQQGATRRLCTQGSVEEAFKESIDNKKTFVKIIVQTNNLQFHPNFKGNDLDLIFANQDDMLRVKRSSAIFANTPSTTTIPLSTGSSAVTGSSAAITQPVPVPVPTNKFRHHLLPPDVKKHYNNHQDPNIVVPI
jgi:hypothetical protein